MVVEPSPRSGPSKPSVADCLQTRPINHRNRRVKIRGELEETTLKAVAEALQIVFALA